jgi:large subunit ribosomal protein L9
MKVLLLRDHDKLGKAGDVKSVADGYARNFLLPRSLAVIATEGALKQAETIRKAEEKRRAKLFAEAQAVANQLTGITLTFHALAGETGKLYGSITASQIAEAIQREKGIEVDKRKLDLREPLRSIGTHTVPIRLAAELVPTVTVIIEPVMEAAAEGAAEETAPAETLAAGDAQPAA